MDEEALWYEGVSIEYIKGKTATLSVYDDEEEVNWEYLSDYETKVDMHALMVEYGFKLKPEAEIEAIKKKIQDKKDMPKDWTNTYKDVDAMRAGKERMRADKKARVQYEIDKKAALEEKAAEAAAGEGAGEVDVEGIEEVEAESLKTDGAEL